jgi:hypothetical protein
MPASQYRQLRHRKLDRFRQKLWAVPAWLWLCIRHRGASPKARHRSSQIR